MVIGCKYWNDRKEYNVQTNDPIEHLYKILVGQIKLKYPQVHWGWLESCGANACTNCLGVTEQGRELLVKLKITPGGYLHQVPHLLMGYLNDPGNWDAMNLERTRTGAAPISNIQGNRVPQYYIALAKYMLGIKAEFKWGFHWEDVKKALWDGHPIQACLINPGHYIAIKAYDTEKDELLYIDSWPRDGKDGWELRLKKDDLHNLQKFVIIYMIK